MTDLITLAQTQNAPVTVVNYPGGHHAFDMFDDEPATRDVIDGTLDFVARSTSPAYQASLRRGIPEATAAAHVAAGEFAAAAASMRDWSRPAPTTPGCACPTAKRCSAHRSSPPPAPSSSA